MTIGRSTETGRMDDTVASIASDWQMVVRPTERTCVIFDLETKTLIPRKHNSRDNAISGMEVSVACSIIVDADLVLTSRTLETIDSTMRSLTVWCDDTPISTTKLYAPSTFARLFDAFDAATVIVAYNGIGFDMLVLQQYYDRTARGVARYRSHLEKLHDPFARIRGVTGFWPKLSMLLALNGHPSKSGDGVNAVRLWDEGKRTELASYCYDDVVLLLRLVLQKGGVVVAQNHVLPSHVTSLRSALVSATCL